MTVATAIPSLRNHLAESWQWLRPQPARWCLRNGGLEIRVWAGFADSVENALLYQVTGRGQDCCSYEVTVENLSQPKQQWEQAGLTWYSDGRRAYYRTEFNGPYLLAGDGQLPLSDNEQVSIQRYHGPTDAEHWIRFTAFRVLRQAK